MRIALRWSIFSILVFLMRLAAFAQPEAISDLAVVPLPVEGQVRLTWTSPVTNDVYGAPSGYDLKYATSEITSADFNSSWVSTYPQSIIALASGMIESTTMYNLTPGVTVYFAVAAQDYLGVYGAWHGPTESGGAANPDSAALMYDTAPAKVAGLTTAAGDAIVTLHWQANTAIDFRQYHVERSSYSSTEGFLPAATLSATTLQDSDLVNGTTYFFRVYAEDANGNRGDYSDVSSTQPWVSLGVPVLAGYSAAVSTVSVSWTWSPVSNAGGYRIVDAASGASLSPDLAPATTCWLQDSLLPNTSSQVCLQAFNGLITSNSASRQVFTLANAPALAASTSTSSGISLEWSAGGNSALTRYTVQRSSSSDFISPATLMNLVPSTTCQDAGLVEGATYYYRVWATNDDNVTTAYAPYNAVTRRIPPSVPVLGTVAGGPFDGAISIDWTASGDDGTTGMCSSYVIKWATFPVTESDFDAIAVSSRIAATLPNPQAEPAQVIAGLYPGTTYYFALRAEDEVGNYSLVSDTKAAVAADNPPLSPASVSAVAVSSSAVAVSWIVPGYAGYDDRDAYRVYRATYVFAAFNAGVSTFSVSHPTTFYVDTDLTPETSYYYRVSCLDKGDAGNGLSSSVLESLLSATTGFARTMDITPPAAVQNLTASTGTVEGMIDLRWSSPGDDGATGAIAGGRFRIDYATDAARNFEVNTYKVEIPTTTSPGSANLLTLTGLSGGATYFIRLWTQDESNNWSPLSNAATGWAQVDVTAPAAITDIAITAAWRQVALSWTAPGDDGTAGTLNGIFEVRLSTEGPINNLPKWNAVPAAYPYRVNLSTSIPALSRPSLHITGLTDAVTYYCSIRSIDESGNESTLSTVSVSTMPYNHTPGSFDLSAPADGSVSVDGQPTFSWTPVSDPDYVFGDVVTYQIFYSTDSGFSDAASTTTFSTSYTAFLVPYEDKTVYWRVWAMDKDGTIIPSSHTYYRVHVNIVNSPPAAFNLIAPADGETMTTASPKLSWDLSTDNDPDDSVAYRVDYSSFSDFSVYASSYLASGTSAYFVPLLSENTTCWWRVWADDGQTKTLCTAIRYFRIDAVPEPPGAFSLTSPAESAVLSTTTITFSWQRSVDPDFDEPVSYELAWSQSPQLLSSVTVSGLLCTSYTATGFMENGVYYWQVTSTDDEGHHRSSALTERLHIDVVKELPGSFDLVEPVYGITVSTTVKPLFNWSRAIDPDPADDVRYTIDISSMPDFSGTGTITADRGTDRYYVPSIGLTDQTTYYWRVRAAGYQGGAIPQPVDSGFTCSSTGTFTVSLVNTPPHPFDLLFPADGSSASSKKVALRWDGAIDTDLNSVVTYTVLLSSCPDFSLLTESAPSVSATSFALRTLLTENMTYYWRVIAVDNKDAATSCTHDYCLYVPALDVPQPPAGLRGTLSTDKMKFTVSWNGVATNSDGSTMDDLAGYRVYRGLSVQKIALYAVVPATVTTWTDENIEGGSFYYRVCAVDISGIENREEDAPVLCSLQGDELRMVSEDGALSVDVPPAVSRYLRAENNEYHQDLRLTLERNSGGENEMVVTSYRITVTKADGTALDALLTQPLTLRFHFGEDAPAVRRRGASPAAAVQLADLNVFWNNGHEYLRMGGTADLQEKTVTLQTVRPGEYQLRRVSRATAFGVASINPPKVFTPGVAPYEKITFSVDNPANDKVVGKVFDLRGEFVADLVALGDATAANVVLEWDGTTCDGLAASKGIYLYQFEGSGKTVNGTIMVAR